MSSRYSFFLLAIFFVGLAGAWVVSRSVSPPVPALTSPAPSESDVQNEATEDVTVRGLLVSIDSDSITVAKEGDAEVEIAILENTTFFDAPLKEGESGTPFTVQDLQVGKTIVVYAMLKDGKFTATGIDRFPDFSQGGG